MKKIKSYILGDAQSANKNAYVWNMIAGLLNASQSVIILMAITRTISLYYAGVFTIAFATASLLINVGNYGMKNYQVTDYSEKFSFNDYVGTRVVTSILMVLVSLGFVAYGIIVNGHSIYKATIIFLVCLLKLIDAVEEVFHAMYQKSGRLDVGAKITSIRFIVVIFCYCIVLFIFKNLMLAAIVALIASALIFIFFTRMILPEFIKTKVKPSFNKVKIILLECIGPFSAAFLSFYIGNAPKYAIDNAMSQEMQAYYGFIAMPVFVIGLLNNFLYQPILISLTNDWALKKYNVFMKRVIKQILIIASLTMLVIAGAYLLGIPVLSILYNTDLKPFKSQLLILLIGGGCLAIAGFMNVIITIIRHQKKLIFGYGGVSILAYIACPIMVKHYGITGAAWIYTILMGLLAITFLLVFIIQFNIDIRKKVE